MAELRGIGVSPGLVGGPAFQVARPPRLPPPGVVTDRGAECATALAALATVAADLAHRADAARDATVADVLRAQVLMADDPTLRDGVRDAVGAGADAVHAIDAALAGHRQAFEAAGGRLAERVSDLDDIRNRAVAACLGVPMPGIPAPGEPFVLLARDLAPADTASLDTRQVLAIVTEAGGPTSHTAILARAIGLPAVVRCPGVLDIADGALVTVDGGAGRVTVGVDRVTVEKFALSHAERRARAHRSRGPGRSIDGHPVPLLANIGSARDLDGDVEGVGLFRTELLYLNRSDPPGLDEQVAAYREVFAAAGRRRVIVRTLDAGADKPLPFLHLAPEPNPALGIRGLRTARQRPELLDSQLTAIALAARSTEAEVWVMAPMVTTALEAADFAARCHGADLPTAGVMVEVPAAALRAPAFLRSVDFLSIGTNDLSQYTFAADRQCGELADLLDPWQPALLELVAACTSAGAAAGKPVGLCGEAAADPVLALVFVGLGVASLSMAANAIPAVRDALASRSIEQCRALAEAALSCDNASQVREAVAQRM